MINTCTQYDNDEIQFVQQVSKRLHTGGSNNWSKKICVSLCLGLWSFCDTFSFFLLVLLSVLESFTILIHFLSHYPSHTYTSLFPSPFFLFILATKPFHLSRIDSHHWQPIIPYNTTYTYFCHTWIVRHP